MWKLKYGERSFGILIFPSWEPKNLLVLLRLVHASNEQTKHLLWQSLKWYSSRGDVRLQARGCMYLVMEFCGGGDMAEYIRRHRRIPETTARSFIQQLAAGLKAMWQNNFVHVRSICST